MKRRLLISLSISLISIFPLKVEAQTDELENKVKQTMLEATTYMVEEVSTHGGYVRTYLPDFSRRWAEVEAFNTQIWIETGWGGGGTAGMGHLFLDAYQATGDEYFYEAAVNAARALIWSQHDSGGWNYLADFAGDRSLQEWYNTIGKNAWGFEEHYHYYGNATFDDNVTTGAAQFLLRIYLEKLDPVFRPALDKAIEFILESQYSLGGWPQRYPLMYDYSKGGKADYTSFYTFNDGVTENNIEFLILCYETLGEERLLEPIRKGMNFYLLTQQGNPQGGWALQYTKDLAPAHARSYEPAALTTGTTVDHVELLLRFYRYTGDRKFLARIPDALDWLESTKLPEDVREGSQRTHPFFVEIGTNKALFPHRRGTGVEDGEYWLDHSDEDGYGYGFNTNLDLDRLRAEYERMEAMSPESASKNSPLISGKFEVYEVPQNYDKLRYGFTDRIPNESEVQEIIQNLDEQGRWLTTGEWISDEHTISDSGEESNTALHSDPVTAGGIMDSSDQEYLSIEVFTNNISLLINYMNR